MHKEFSINFVLRIKIWMPIFADRWFAMVTQIVLRSCRIIEGVKAAV